MKLLASLALLFAFTSANAATAAAPKVVFVGDWLTYYWATSFPANWTAKASTANVIEYAPEMAAAIAMKPSIIHIMEGSMNASGDFDSTFNVQIPNLETELSVMIQQAQAAKIQVVLGIEPFQFTYPSSALQQMDAAIEGVGMKYGVPIVNYSGAFNGTAEAFGGLYEETIATPQANYSPQAPTAGGYAIMTMMAQEAFATVGANVKSVYLQDVESSSENTAGSPVSNVNTVMPGNTVNFYPVVTYSNGVTQQALLNCDYVTGSCGSWTSSNVAVGSVSRTGEFWALAPGSTIVKFVLPNGVWNEWIMTVQN